MAKTLEFKIRPPGGKSREDQQDAVRVYFSSDALASLQLKPGDLCQLWVSGNPENSRATGVAWNAPATPTIGKGVLLMHPNFRDACGFTLQDPITVTPAESMRTASLVCLHELDNSNGVVGDDERYQWEARLKYSKLVDAKFIYKGMVLETALDQVKRRFMVTSLQDSIATPVSLMAFTTGTGVNIIQAGEESNGVPNDRSELKIIDMAGVDQALAKLNDFISNFNSPLPPVLRYSKGVVVHGASGTGKTHLLNKISDDSQWPMFRVAEDTKAGQLSAIFTQAVTNEPSLLIIDDIDSMISADKGQALAKALATEMKNLTLNERVSSARVIIIATAKSFSGLPSALRSFGTFHENILLPVPNTFARKEILASLLKIHSAKCETGWSERLGDATHAYTAGDLALLLAQAYKAMSARIRATEKRPLTMEDVLVQEDAVKAKIAVPPSAMHDINLQPPKIYWDDIGGQEVVKKALKRAVEIPIKFPHLMLDLGMASKKGLLLYGPPGCSKTLSAQAMATEAGFNFFAVKGAELLNMYVGESERAVRDIFTRARAASPSIIFFDEIESIGSKREGKNSGVNVLTTLLNEMDGIETLEGVTVLAATNQPESLDLALLRPGRFDDLLYVAPPDQSGREAILRVRQKKSKFSDDVDIGQLADLLKGHTGAEIVSVCQKAADIVLDRVLETGCTAQIAMEDFKQAAPRVKMQVTQAMVMKYEIWAAGLKL